MIELYDSICESI